MIANPYQCIGFQDEIPRMRWICSKQRLELVKRRFEFSSTSQDVGIAAAGQAEVRGKFECSLQQGF